VNNCDRENIKAKLGRIHFLETMKILFYFCIFNIFENSRSILKNSKSGEGDIASIFSYVYQLKGK
jgi:hypothetical protein